MRQLRDPVQGFLHAHAALPEGVRFHWWALPLLVLVTTPLAVLANAAEFRVMGAINGHVIGWLSGGVELMSNLTLPFNRIAIIAFAALVLVGVALLIGRTRLGTPTNGNAPRPPGACRILMIGDLIGKPGRVAVEQILGELRDERGIDFVTANGENVAGGMGLTASTADGLLGAPIVRILVHHAAVPPTVQFTLVSPTNGPNAVSTYVYGPPVRFTTWLPSMPLVRG